MHVVRLNDDDDELGTSARCRELKLSATFSVVIRRPTRTSVGH